MRGSDLCRRAEKYINSKWPGSYVINIIVSGKSGDSDIVASIEGVFCSFEIKGEGDTIKELQIDKIRKVLRSKGRAGVVRRLSDIDDIVKGSQSKLDYKSKRLSL